MLYDRKRWEPDPLVVAPEKPKAKPRTKPKFRYAWQQMLYRAAAYIQRHGWLQGARRNKGRVCLLGALDAVEYQFTHHDRLLAERKLRRAIGDIAAFNDHVDTTKSAALAQLRAVAKGE